MKKFDFAILFLLIVNFFQMTISQELDLNTKVGMTASIQGGQIDALIPIKIKNVSIAPSIGFVWSQDAASDYRIGIVPRLYLSEGKAMPYLGGRCGLLIYKPVGGNSVTDYMIGLSGGGEYFIDSHFSISVETQLNLTVSNENSSRFGNPGKNNINTATAVFISYYF